MSGTYLSKIPVLVVALVIGIVLVTSAVVPLASDYSEAKTFTNEGYYRMTETTEETVIVWDPSTDPFTITVNDVDISLNSLKGYGYSNYSLAFAEDIIVRYYYESANSQNLQIWNGDYQVGIGSTSSYVATITITDSTVTYTQNSEDYVTKSFTHSGSFFVIDNDGDYVMKYRDKAAYMLKDDSTFFYAGGISGIATSTFSGFYITGTVDDYTVTPMRNNITVTNEDSTYSAVSGYIDLVTFSQITFDTNYQPSDTPNERSQTYSYFLVPYEVSADPDNPVAYKNLVKVVPLMAFIMLVVAAAGMVYFKNKD